MSGEVVAIPINRLLPSRREPVFDFVAVPVKTKQPDGIVLAGMTDAMYAAFWDGFDEAYKHRGHKESTDVGYNAMIEAAPKRG